jgi:DNA-binding transcriptional regulator YiaG
MITWYTPYINEILEQKIRKLRKERGLKRVELAKALGVGSDTMKNWERGKISLPGTFRGE